MYSGDLAHERRTAGMNDVLVVYSHDTAHFLSETKRPLSVQPPCMDARPHDTRSRRTPTTRPTPDPDPAVTHSSGNVQTDVTKSARGDSQRRSGHGSRPTRGLPRKSHARRFGVDEKAAAPPPPRAKRTPPPPPQDVYVRASVLRASRTGRVPVSQEELSTNRSGQNPISRRPSTSTGTYRRRQRGPFQVPVAGRVAGRSAAIILVRVLGCRK